MFYWMALANGILDALKDTLVVTAFGRFTRLHSLTSHPKTVSFQLRKLQINVSAFTRLVPSRLSQHRTDG